MDGTGTSDSKYVIFLLSGANCALPLSVVLEILPTATLLRPPRLSSLIEGFLNLGGRAIPVLRLDRLLGLPEHRSGLYTHIIRIQEGTHTWAFLVDRASSVASVPPSDLMGIKPEDSFNGCATGMARVEGQVVHLLSPSRLLLEKERGMIAEFAKAAQERLDGVV